MAPDTLLTARLERRAALAEGSAPRVNVDVDRLYFFDPRSGSPASSSRLQDTALAAGQPTHSRALPRAPWASYSRSSRASESSARLTVSSQRLGSSNASHDRGPPTPAAHRSGAANRAASATTPASRQPPACGITA